MRAGQMAESDVARLQAHSGGATGKAGIQKALQSFVSPLTPTQLAQHEKFHAKVNPYVERAHGVLFPSLPGEGDAYTMLRTGQVHADQNTWRAAGEKNFGTLPPSAYRSTLEHEFAESRMVRGEKDKRYIAREFATHKGPAAVIAERLGFQNPDVHAYRDLLREDNPLYMPGDQVIQKKLRQHGMVGNYVMPLGGRAHRSIDAPRALRRKQHALDAKIEERKRQIVPEIIPDFREKYRLYSTPSEREQGFPGRLPNPRTDAELDGPEVADYILRQAKQKAGITSRRDFFKQENVVTPVRDFIASQSGG